MTFDLRFQGGADQYVIIRNHKQGSWGTEERDIPFFPFKTSVPFRISILFEKKVFKVFFASCLKFYFRTMFRYVENKNIKNVRYAY